MSKLKTLILLFLTIIIFYILPLFAGPTDMMGLIFLIMISINFLSIIIGIVVPSKIKYIYPIVVCMMFAPSIYIYYNESAFIYLVFLLFDSFFGLFLGFLIKLVLNNFKDIIQNK